MKTNLKTSTDSTNNHPVVQETKHFINGLEFESAVSFCHSLLWQLAQQNKTIRYEILLSKLKKHLRLQLKKTDYNRVLRKVNERTWNRSKVLLTILVHCSNHIAGTGLFAQARKLGAIRSYPEDIDTRQRLARNFESRVFSIAKCIQHPNQ